MKIGWWMTLGLVCLVWSQVSCGGNKMSGTFTKSVTSGDGKEDCPDLMKTHPAPGFSGPAGSAAAAEASELATRIQRDRARQCENFNMGFFSRPDYLTGQRLLDEFDNRLDGVDSMIMHGEEDKARAEIKALREAYESHPLLQSYNNPPTRRAVAPSPQPSSVAASPAAAAEIQPKSNIALQPRPTCRPQIVTFMEQLIQRFASTYYAVTPLTCDRGRAGLEKTFEVDLTEGACHKIIGASDEGTDLDIVVKGIAEDTKTDNYPIIEFCGKGRYVIKAFLSQGSGDFGVQVFSSEVAPPPPD